MSAIDPSGWMRQVRPIIGALKTPSHVGAPHAPSARPIIPFITISRQAGAGAWVLTQGLVERLNEIDPGELAWSGWDRELIEKVAADHHISRDLVESLEERDHSWLSEFLSGLSISSEAPSEETVFRDVSTTVRALAQAGRVVIIGTGAVFIAKNLPGAVHVRLIAPLEHRIHSLSQRNNLTHHQAEHEVKRLDHNREAFYARHWPSHSLIPDMFHLTVNVGKLNEEQTVDCIAALVTARRRSIHHAQG